MKQKPSKFQYYVVSQLKDLIYYLNTCYLKHILSYNQNQTTVNTNELSSVMNVRRNGFHNGVMAYMLQFDESTILRIFVPWIVLMEAIFSWLDLKPDEVFLLYSMPKVFSKTGHGFTDIIISLDKFKPVLHPEIFWTGLYVYLLCSRVELNALYHSLGLCQKSF